MILWEVQERLEHIDRVQIHLLLPGTSVEIRLQRIKFQNLNYTVLYALNFAKGDNE
jgi:hypothetical protein